MLRFLKMLLAIPAALAIVLFAVANRQTIRVSFDPFSREAPALFVDVPLFTVALAALAIGIVLGGVAAWLAQGHHRKAERQLKREVNRLSNETANLKAATPESSLASLPSVR
ncbi:MAG: LapA family protein [Bosea sp. (in: a-proteobacteria)]